MQQGQKSVLEAYCFEESLLRFRPEVCTSQDRENEKRNRVLVKSCVPEAADGCPRKLLDT